MNDNLNAVLGGLNEEQKKAVCCTDGAVLIVAGAGSGKTKVLTGRIAYMLASGVKAQEILALTFTKKAAGEMKERIAAMVGEKSARRLVMGTFHSVFIRFLRTYAGFLGYPSNFTIYDTSDSQSAIKACVKQLGLDDKIYKPRDVLSRISMAKNNLITVQAYKDDPKIATADAHSKKPRMADVYALYQQKMKESGVMDFDDILVNMNILLRDNKDALADLSQQFRYIMVDEYQDTNFAQYLILKKLASAHGNICVVGDDSQSIYAFRGAKIENILNFSKDYPARRIFRLERNYRSTANIVNAANSLIAHNEDRIPKTCYAAADSEGEKLRLLHSYNEQLEATALTEEIASRMRRDAAQYRDFAILYRTNAQSRALEEALRHRNIPYMIYSGNSFFERAEVKDLMAYFKLAVNPMDNESFRRVVNKPARGIGATTLAAVEMAATQEHISFFEAGRRVAKVKPFCDMIEEFSQLVPTADPHELAESIAKKSTLYAFYQADTSIEGLSRMANIDELLNSVAIFVENTKEEASEADEPVPAPSLADYLENVSLLSNADTPSEEDDSNKVALMTVHSAKGLEFPYVMVAGMEENLFPNLGMLSSARDLEEERRLFYVAITRAKKAVVLSFADTRMRNGQHESNAPSRFIREIDSQYIENPLPPRSFSTETSFPARAFQSGTGYGSRYGGGPSYGSRNPYGQSGPARTVPRQSAVAPGASRAPAGTVAARPAPRQSDPAFSPTPVEELRAGDRVEHRNFGTGTIISIEGQLPNLRAEVNFSTSGMKTLLLKFAKLRKLG